MPFCCACGEKETKARVFVGNNCMECYSMIPTVNDETITTNEEIQKLEFWSKLNMLLDEKFSKFSEKIDERIEAEINKNVEPIKYRIQILEEKNRIKDEKINTLETIVINQQNSLTFIDVKSV